MDTARTEQSGKGSGRPIQSDHPFPRALARSGITIAEWARRHHVSPEVVRSWYAAQPHQQRRIPRRMAEAIAAEFGLPADESTWPQGLK
ncbi:MAG TPA: hypothetical protein VFJ24_09380 [Gaiellales bacterium]|nr:hypothetical protein [Gaiellales bacterium]